MQSKPPAQAAWHKKTYAAKGAKRFYESIFELRTAAKKRPHAGVFSVGCSRIGAGRTVCFLVPGGLYSVGGLDTAQCADGRQQLRLARPLLRGEGDGQDGAAGGHQRTVRYQDLRLNKDRLAQENTRFCLRLSGCNRPKKRPHAGVFLQPFSAQICFHKTASRLLRRMFSYARRPEPEVLIALCGHRGYNTRYYTLRRAQRPI